MPTATTSPSSTAGPSTAPAGPGAVPPSGTTVGVVVPAYDAERWVEATLVSLLAQTHEDWRCVVVDDGSTDATAAVVARLARQDPRIHLLSQANTGLPGARNAGLAALPAECELVAFIDSDDTYLPDALGVLVERLTARPDAVGAYGLAEYMDERGEPLALGEHPKRQRERRQLIGRTRMVTLPDDADATFDTMVVAGPIWPPAVALHRRSAVEAVGGFDVAFPMQEDWEFLIRTSRLGPYAATDRHVVWYRRHGANMTSKYYEIAHLQARVRRLAAVSPQNTPAQHRQVVNSWRYLEARQVRQLALYAVAAVRARRWRTAARLGVGAVLVTATLAGANPPRLPRAAARWMQPQEMTTDFPTGAPDVGDPAAAPPAPPAAGTGGGSPPGRAAGALPVVGVVVPAYDAQRWVGATLRSLQEQTFQDWRCVVVDDGSTDATAEVVAAIAAQDPRIHLLRQANTGLPGARNAGLAVLPAECDLVAFLDSDDTYLPDALSALVDLLAQRPDAVGAYGLAEYMDERGQPLALGDHPARQRSRRQLQGLARMRTLPDEADATFATMVVVGPIWPPAVALHRRAVVDRVGGFDVGFPMQEDWEFLIRTSRHGPYAALDRQVVWYRRHGSNMSSRSEEIAHLQARVRRLAWRSPQNTAEQRRLVARAWRYLEARQARELLRHAGASARARRWGSASSAGRGALVIASQIVRPGPPEVSLRTARLVHPGAIAVPFPETGGQGPGTGGQSGSRAA